MNRYARTEAELIKLTSAFARGEISAEALPARLELLAANLRTVIEAEKSLAGKPHEYGRALALAVLARSAIDEPYRVLS